MAQTQVQVIEVHEHHLRVAGQRSGGCSACAQRSHCGVQGAELSSKKHFTLEVPYLPADTGKIQPGETLTLACDEKHLLSAILTLFGPPLMGLILVPLIWMLGATQEPSDLSIFICALLGTLVGLAVSRHFAKKCTPSTARSIPTISVVTNPTKTV